jgi:acetolactate synthase-1/2/3 large subunit
VRRPDVPIVGDCRLVLEELVKAVSDLAASEAPGEEVAGASRSEGGAQLGPGAARPDALGPDRGAWMTQLAEWQTRFPLTYEREPEDGSLKPQRVIEALRDSVPEDTVVVAGVGQHQMWTSQYWRFRHPYTWVNSGGLGTMGFAVPAAIGAKVGRPEAMVWAVDGDGCFQMTAQELVTASAERIPIKVAVLNNAYLGMVRQWQEMFYDERYSEVYLSPDLPDYVKWAEAMGCIGLRVERPEEVQPAIDKANQIDDRPVVVEFRTDSGEKVYPMVPAGASNDDIVVDPSQGEGGR